MRKMLTALSYSILKIYYIQNIHVTAYITDMIYNNLMISIIVLFIYKQSNILSIVPTACKTDHLPLTFSIFQFLKIFLIELNYNDLRKR